MSSGSHPHYPHPRSKAQSVIRSLTERTDYIKNPEKTENGALIYAHGCTPQLVAAEFALSKRLYMLRTGCKEPGVIAYHIRQSFKPGEITPEEANRVGRELVERFLKGKHAYIVCTHTDKKHIHSHIIFNSTTLDGAAQIPRLPRLRARARAALRPYLPRARVVRNCQPAALHAPRPTTSGSETKKPPSHRDVLRADIDAALARKPKSFDELLDILRQSGWEVSAGAHVTFQTRRPVRDTPPLARRGIFRGRAACCDRRQLDAHAAREA